MGKVDAPPPDGSSSSTPSHLGESAASITLSSSTYFPSDRHLPPSHRYFDEDPAEFADDDLPPLYTDHEEFNNDDARPFDPLMPQLRDDGFETVHPFRDDGISIFFLDPRLDRDPDILATHIDRLSMVPPRPFVSIVGTHTEKPTSNDKNRETKDVTDFELEIELTHLLYSDIRAAQAWRSVNTAGNFEKVRRGTVFATRAPGFGGCGSLPEEGVPGLREWCRRYCASRAGLKCFTMERRIEGFDWDMLRRQLEGLVRATNYRGNVKIEFPVRHSHVHVYNDCRINRWRLTKWIVMIFMFTLMFVFTWPYLFFKTKRWETITAEWRMSEPTAVPGRKKYVSMSEEQWYTMWAGTLQKAMLERRRGVLDQGDLERTRVEGERREGFAGTVQVGMEAMGVVNRSFGWGGDTC